MADDAINISLLEMSNAFLTNLHILENDPELLESVHRDIGETIIAHQLPIYDTCVDFFKDKRTFPTPDFLSSFFQGMFTPIYLPTYNYDVAWFFYNRIRKDAMKTRAVRAASGEEYEKLEQIITALDPGKVHRKITMSEVLDAYALRKERPGGFTTGVEDIDREVVGLSRGTITVVAAPTSCFKTTFGISMLYKAVMEDGLNAAYLSLEGMAEDVLFNLLSRHSREYTQNMDKAIPAQKLKKGGLSKTEEQLAAAVKDDWEQKCKGKLEVIMPEDVDDFGPAAIKGLLKKAFPPETPLDLLIVDYLQLFKAFPMRGIKDPYELLNQYVLFFARMARTFREGGVTLVLLAQINREGWKRMSNKNVAELFYLAEASELERSADQVVVMFATGEEKLNSTVRMALLKNRHGAIMEVLKPQYVEPAFYKVGQGSGESKTLFHAGMMTEDAYRNRENSGPVWDPEADELDGY